MWQSVENSIVKDFEFGNFKAALAFVNRVAELAEAENHHPDFLLHDWKFVRLTLSTHSEGRVTEKDHELSKKIDTLL